MRASSSRGSIRGFRGGASSSTGRGGSSNNSNSNPRSSNSNSSGTGRPTIQPSSNSSSKANPALLALGNASGGIGGTWGKARDPTGRITQYKSDSDKCPICNNARYFRPELKLLISTCYHIACSSCIDRVFSQGPADCPTCGLTIRKTDFGLQTFEDLQVEKEVDVRRRVAKLFDKKQEDFESLDEWNSYLEMVEEITFNLIHDLEPEETLKKIEAYKAKERPAPNSFLPPTNSSKDSSTSETDPTSSSQAYLSEDFENNQRKARAMRDMSRKERDSQLKKKEEKEIMRFLENDKGGNVDNDVEKIKRKYQEEREKNEREDEKEDEMLNRMEKERLREKELKNSSSNSKKSKRKFNGSGSAKDVEGDRIGVDGEINGREWSHEMLLDFKGPLSTLDDCDYLWRKDLKDPSPILYGGSSKKRTEEELWLNRLCWDQQYSQRARAGGFDYMNWWARSAREGCETLGIGLKGEKGGVEMKG